MTYTVYDFKSEYLKPIDKNVNADDLKKYGEPVSKIYNHYDKDKATECGFVFANKIYALVNK